MNNSLPPVDLPNAHDMYEDVDYRQYWEGAARRKLDELERELVGELLPAHGNAIIDIGCGYGRLFDCYAGRFDHIVMFDGSASLLRQAQRRDNGRTLYVQGDVNRLPFHKSAFDAVLMIRIFHHLNDSESAMRVISEIMCDEGALVMNYSNKRNAQSIFRYWMGRTRHNPFALEPLTVEANFFHHHPASVTRLLVGLGFQALTYRGAGVMDKLAPLLGRFAPNGKHLAPLFGNVQLAPWVFCRAIASNRQPRRICSHAEDLLACPACCADVFPAQNGFRCKSCSQMYPIKDGIIDMNLNGKEAV